MDDGVAAALFALVLGLPMIVLSALFAGLTSALVVFAIVGSLALAFVAASWLAGDDGFDTAGDGDEREDESEDVDTSVDVEDSKTATGSAAELEQLRERYARGDLTETELEREIDRALETGAGTETQHPQHSPAEDTIGRPDTHDPDREQSESDPELERE